MSIATSITMAASLLFVGGIMVGMSIMMLVFAPAAGRSVLDQIIRLIMGVVASALSFNLLLLALRRAQDSEKRGDQEAP